MPYLSNPALPFIREDYPGNRFENGQFLNDAHIEFEQTSFWEVVKWQIGKNPQKAEKKADEFILEVIPGADFVTDDRDLIVWLGHASFFIRLAGVSFLTDPCLRSLPMIPRKVGLPCEIRELKGIDYLLLSHGHRDHFDKPSLQKIIPNNFGIEALVPLKLG
ncbi:MAG: MBL fold metallo-hydrolase, partial [Bacteroidota bacterium]